MNVNVPHGYPASAGSKQSSADVEHTPSDQVTERDLNSPVTAALSDFFLLNKLNEVF